jgi:hypothetical protein
MGDETLPSGRGGQPPDRGSYVLAGCHSCVAFGTSGNTDCTFLSIPCRLRLPIGCCTTTRAISATPCSSTKTLNFSSNGEVTMVIVGMPFFSILSWSTTSREVQFPQSESAWAAIPALVFEGQYPRLSFRFARDRPIGRPCPHRPPTS